MSLWKDVKQAFSGENQQLDETGKAILDIENKKKAIVQASNNEQILIREKIDEEYRMVGETSYTLYAEGNFEIERVSAMFGNIKVHYKTLDEKQAKLREILNRYDEELQILRPAPPEGQAFCKDCGTAYISGEMAFCSNCGNKLDADIHTSEAVTAPVQQPKCSSCNTENITAAAFCSNCGDQL